MQKKGRGKKREGATFLPSHLYLTKGEKEKKSAAVRVPPGSGGQATYDEENKNKKKRKETLPFLVHAGGEGKRERVFLSATILRSGRGLKSKGGAKGREGNEAPLPSLLPW